MALTQQEIARITNTYRTHKSIRKTQRITGFGLGTVHKYVRETFPHTNTQQKVTSLNNQDPTLIGTYVGLWMGDGTQYITEGSYVVKICSNKQNKILNSFIADIFVSLFGKKPKFNSSTKKKDLYIRIYSKFIYEFIKQYVSRSRHKTSTVRLKQAPIHYPTQFIEGVLLGLVLSDGYIKQTMVYRTTSKQLATDVKEILMLQGFSPTHREKARKEKNWRNIHTIRLCTQETQALKSALNDTILYTGTNKTITQIKYG